MLEIKGSVPLSQPLMVREQVQFSQEEKYELVNLRLIIGWKGFRRANMSRIDYDTRIFEHAIAIKECTIKKRSTPSQPDLTSI